jgi:hypothetical protein
VTDKRQEESHERMKRSVERIERTEGRVERGKQRTSKGLEIPVPKRSDLMDAFRKVIKPVKKR